MRITASLEYSNTPTPRRQLKLISFALCALLAALCFPAKAQQQVKTPRIGILMSGSPEPRLALLDALRDGLRDIGYVEGNNLAIEYRFTEGRDERLLILLLNWCSYVCR